MKHLLITLTLLPSILYAPISIPQNPNQQYLSFLQQSCQSLFQTLPPTQSIPQISKKQLKHVRKIIWETNTLLLIDNSYSFKNPTQEEQTTCVEYRSIIAKYDELLKLYRQAYPTKHKKII